MTEKTDRRALRTKKALKSALLEMLKKKDITKVTVSELVEKADIGRGTFYLHYNDPFDLLDKIENEILEEISFCELKLSEADWQSYLLAHFKQVWQYIYSNQEYFKILMRHQSGVRFLKKFNDYCEKSTLSAIGKESYDSIESMYNIVYVISGTLGIFQKWMKDGTVITPEQLAQITFGIVKGGEKNHDH